MTNSPAPLSLTPSLSLSPSLAFLDAQIINERYMNEGMKNEFLNFRQKIMHKVTKELIKSAPIISIPTTITVLTPVAPPREPLLTIRGPPCIYAVWETLATCKPFQGHLQTSLNVRVN
eukprot:sb/3476403/